MTDKTEGGQETGASNSPIPESQVIGNPAAQGGTDLAVFDPTLDAGLGLENVQRDWYTIPFLNVLDPKSPQCAPPTAGGVPGAKAGNLYNNATGEMFDGVAGVPFIPSYNDENYVEWIKRNEDGSGGGFIGIRSATDPLVIELKKKFGERGKLITTDNHELVQTCSVYGLTVTDGMGSPVVVRFKSTGLQSFRNFITRAKSIYYVGPGGKPVQPALWSHLWMIGTQYKPAKQPGQSGWYIPKLWLSKEPSRAALIKQTDMSYKQARDLYEAIKAGHVTVEQESESPKEEIPF